MRFSGVVFTPEAPNRGFSTQHAAELPRMINSRTSIRGKKLPRSNYPAPIQFKISNFSGVIVWLLWYFPAIEIAVCWCFSLRAVRAISMSRARNSLPHCPEATFVPALPSLKLSLKLSLNCPLKWFNPRNTKKKRYLRTKNCPSHCP